MCKAAKADASSAAMHKLLQALLISSGDSCKAAKADASAAAMHKLLQYCSSVLVMVTFLVQSCQS